MVLYAWHKFECEEGYVAYYVSRVDVAPNDEYKWMKFGWFWPETKQEKMGSSPPENRLSKYVQ